MRPNTSFDTYIELASPPGLLVSVRVVPQFRCIQVNSDVGCSQ